MPALGREADRIVGARLRWNRSAVASAMMYATLLLRSGLGMMIVTFITSEGEGLNDQIIKYDATRSEGDCRRKVGLSHMMLNPITYGGNVREHLSEISFIGSDQEPGS